MTLIKVVAEIFSQMCTEQASTLKKCLWDSTAMDRD